MNIPTRTFAALLALLITSALGCGAHPEETSSGTGELEQPLRFGVWGGGWEPASNFARTCWFNSGSQCFFPSAQSIGDPWVVKTSDATTGWTAGFSKNTAREFADALWVEEGVGWAFTPTGCTPQNPNCTNLHFVNNDALIGVMDPAQNYPISAVARAMCTSSSELSPNTGWLIQNVDVDLCHRIIVMIDVQSLTQWINAWSFAPDLPQSIMNRIYSYFYGVSIGVGHHGHTTLPDTLMHPDILRGPGTGWYGRFEVTDTDRCKALDINSLVSPGQAVWDEFFTHCD